MMSLPGGNTSSSTTLLAGDPISSIECNLLDHQRRKPAEIDWIVALSMRVKREHNMDGITHRWSDSLPSDN